MTCVDGIGAPVGAVVALVYFWRGGSSCGVGGVVGLCSAGSVRREVART